MNSAPTATSREKRAKGPLLCDGTVLSEKWEIIQHIATGGKGEVYLARQANLDRHVVVKIVSTEYLKEFAHDEDEIRTEIGRFHREAMAMAQIRHPHVVLVYDQDSATIPQNEDLITIQYVVMEYVAGSTLRATMPENGFRDNDRAARTWIRDFFLPILEGVDAIHQSGIVHRDIKPENVLLDGTIPKITDFGVAGGRIWPQLTRSYHVEGTIPYMAPEQFTELGEADVRADVYALGKVLYEAVEGKMVDQRTACPLKRVGLAHPKTSFMKGLNCILQKATAEDRDERTSSVRALSDELKTLIEEADAADRPLLRGLHRKQVLFLAAALLILLAASNVYHHFVMTHDASTPSHVSGEPADRTVESVVTAADAPAPPKHVVTPPPTLTGNDGALMRLVAGGQVKIPTHVAATELTIVDVPSFYLDATEVTNQQFVEFLNQVLSTVDVRGRVVRGEGRPWLLLGPVYTGFEPIVYRSGRFALNDPSVADHPVVKVTGHGAEEYARFHNKRLPTENEWLLAATRGTETAGSRKETVQAGDIEPEKTEQDMEGWVEAFAGGERSQVPRQQTPLTKEGPREDDLSEPGHGGATSRIPYPVTRFRPNADGIRGLTENVSEWALRSVGTLGPQSTFVIVGGLRGTMRLGSALFPGLAFDPSTAFEDVGFRCAVDPPDTKP